jgi:hypothetical protein
VTFNQVRRICLALPEVEERETWGDVTFRVRNKIFMIEMAPETFSAAAYTGRYGWVRVQLKGLSPQLAERLIANAWRRTAPKRLVAKLTP